MLWISHTLFPHDKRSKWRQNDSRNKSQQQPIFVLAFSIGWRVVLFVMLVVVVVVLIVAVVVATALSRWYPVCVAMRVASSIMTGCGVLFRFVSFHRAVVDGSVCTSSMHYILSMILVCSVFDLPKEEGGRWKGGERRRKGKERPKARWNK